MAGEERRGLPAPATSSADSPKPLLPPTFLGQLREIREAARDVGKLLDDPEEVTVGEFKRRGVRLLQLLGFTR